MATSDVTQGLTADAYGQFHPVESDALIALKLEELATHVAALPDEATGALREAQTKCPEQLSDDFKLMFLRSEVFNADVSSSRIVGGARARDREDIWSLPVVSVCVTGRKIPFSTSFTTVERYTL
jgi:hypothetical protein